MKKIVFLIIVLLVGGSNLQAQRVNKERLLIDLPTASTIGRGRFAIELRMFKNGGLLTSVAVGLTPRLMIGLSYGGENIIGEGDINWNPEPGVQARVRIIDENFALPAITLGFDSQGYGAYDDSLSRYQNKSRGLFAVASKNYKLLLNLGLHGGLNYSTETDDDDKNLNLFVGADLRLNREFKVIAEYDFARNDNENEFRFGSGNGYLNAALQWTFSNRLFIQLNLKNLFQNGPNDLFRELTIGYFERF